jgi:serine/threonine protein kinase
MGLQKAGDLRTAFILMDGLPGGTLKSLYLTDSKSSVRRATFSTEVAMRWACQLTDAVAYMHSPAHRVIHRDIKLENILLTSSNLESASIKLADFGLAVQLSTRSRCSPVALKELQKTLRTGAAFAGPDDGQIGYCDVSDGVHKLHQPH